MKKIVILDRVEEGYEPYDRKYILGEVALCCQRNSSILRNASMTTVWARGYLGHEERWEDHNKWVHCVSLEAKYLDERVWGFLQEAVGSGRWPVELGKLSDEWETTVHYPSEFTN